MHVCVCKVSEKCLRITKDNYFVPGVRVSYIQYCITVLQFSSFADVP